MPYGIGNLMAGIPTGDLRILKDSWPYLVGYRKSIFFIWGFFLECLFLQSCQAISLHV